MACWVSAAAAQSTDRRALKIAGLSLGAPAAQVQTSLGAFGFDAAKPAADPASAERAQRQTLRTLHFQRGDGHEISVGIEKTEAPAIRSIAYRMGRDIDTHARLFDYIRSTYGPPHAVHGGTDSLRILVWEIPGAEMTAEGVLATSIVLVSDPVTGHSVTLGEVVKRLSTASPRTGAPEGGVSRD